MKIFKNQDDFPEIDRLINENATPEELSNYLRLNWLAIYEQQIMERHIAELTEERDDSYGAWSDLHDESNELADQLEEVRARYYKIKCKEDHYYDRFTAASERIKAWEEGREPDPVALSPQIGPVEMDAESQYWLDELREKSGSQN